MRRDDQKHADTLVSYCWYWLFVVKYYTAAKHITIMSIIGVFPPIRNPLLIVNYTYSAAFIVMF